MAIASKYTWKNVADTFENDWNNIKEDNTIMTKGKKDIKTLLCCIGRLENDYIRDFVEYYKTLGFTNICLCDNNREGEDDFHDVIGDYIDSGYIILKDYRNVTAPTQCQAYNECYKEYGGSYDWVAFFDIDEYLFLNEDKTISEYLFRKEFEDFNGICLNWVMYGDNDQLKPDGRSVLERFPKHLPLDKKGNYGFPDTFHVKSIIRGGLKKMEFEVIPHVPNIEGTLCNGSGIQIQIQSKAPFIPYNFKLAGIKHFTTKTAEEYIKKIKRGFCDGNGALKEELAENFFKKNKATPEKVKLFKDELGVDMAKYLPYTGDKMTKIQIYELCYEDKGFAPPEDSVITPLQVGAANGTDVCYLKDNTGDNISGGNLFYVENTGTYWIWKNDKSEKYKGQMQYRRILSGITEQTNFDEIFNDHDVITCVPYHYPDHKTPTKEEPMVIPADTLEQGYAFSNCLDDLLIMEMVVKLNHPDYADDWDKYIKNGEDLYYSNGFIMRKEDYDRYAEFLFGCLNGYFSLAQIRTKDDLINHVRYNMETAKYQRYSDGKIDEGAIRWQCCIGGFLSERIWTLWLLHNFKEERIYKVPYRLMEKNMYM